MGIGASALHNTSPRAPAAGSHAPDNQVEVTEKDDVNLPDQTNNLSVRPDGNLSLEHAEEYARARIMDDAAMELAIEASRRAQSAVDIEQVEQEQFLQAIKASLEDTRPPSQTNAPNTEEEETQAIAEAVKRSMEAESARLRLLKAQEEEEFRQGLINSMATAPIAYREYQGADYQRTRGPHDADRHGSTGATEARRETEKSFALPSYHAALEPVTPISSPSSTIARISRNEDEPEGIDEDTPTLPLKSVPPVTLPVAKKQVSAGLEHKTVVPGINKASGDVEDTEEHPVRRTIRLMSMPPPQPSCEQIQVQEQQQPQRTFSRAMVKVAGKILVQ